MADALYELLATQTPEEGEEAKLAAKPDPAALEYLTRLVSQPLSSLETEESQSLGQSSHSLLISLQGLAKKAHKPIIESAAQHATLTTSLPALIGSVNDLKNAIPKLDAEAVRFSTTYNKANEQDVELLAQRKKALLLSRNVERVVDVLELPTLLASAISTVPANYASALDLNGHIRRLHSLYPESPLVTSISAEAEEAMQTMAANLILSLKAPSLRLAAALRTVSWLRRVLPDLEPANGHATTTSAPRSGQDSQDRVLGGLFLVCRLATLMNMLHALEPLRELADQEKARQKSIGSGNAWSGGQQTERYLKRYIEIFREQSFAIVSMFKSIFPGNSAGDAPLPSPSLAKTQRMKPLDARDGQVQGQGQNLLMPLPSALSTFPLHLVEMLLETLRLYLPTVKDQASRDSLLTQVLYCAASLGRLGGDFGLFLAGLDVGSEAEEEWVQVVKRHRQLAGRLESIVGDQRERKQSS